MALNDAVPSSATDVFKRNAEDTDRLLNQTANVVNRVGTTLETFPSSTGRVSTAADAAQVAIQADVDTVESKKNSALIDIQIDVDAAESAKNSALSSYTQWNSRGDWATATAYAKGDIWNNTATSTWYLVLNAYTSGATVNDDIAGPNVTVLQGAKYGTFEGLSNAVAFVTAHPELFPDNTAVSTSSYRTQSECDSLGIDYPDGGGADYVVGTGFGVADGGSIIDAGAKQLRINNKDTYINSAIFGVYEGQINAFQQLKNCAEYAESKDIRLIYVKSNVTSESDDQVAFSNITFFGEGSISGIYRKAVFPTPYNTTKPCSSEIAANSKSKLTIENPVAVLVGDSISTYSANTRNRNFMLSGALENKIREEFSAPEFYNRAIGGATLTNLTGISSRASEIEWYTDTGRPWLDYVEDLNPDVVFLSFGMNDSFNINYDSLKTVVSTINAFSKRPQIVFCTTLTPSLSGNPGGATATKQEQEGRDYAAGVIRTFARFHGYGLLDFNRQGNMARDGLDVVAGRVGQTETTFPTASPITGTKESHSYRIRLSIDEAKLIDSGAVYVDYALDNEFRSKIRIRNSGGNYRIVVNAATVQGTIETLEIIETGLAVGSGTKRMALEVRGGLITIYDDSSFLGESTPAIATFKTIRGGGAITPKAQYVPDSLITQSQIDYGDGYICSPTIYNDLLWGDKYEATSIKEWGGSGWNHPSTHVMEHIYLPVLSAANFKGEGSRLSAGISDVSFSDVSPSASSATGAGAKYGAEVSLPETGGSTCIFSISRPAKPTIVVIYYRIDSSLGTDVNLQLVHHSTAHNGSKTFNALFTNILTLDNAGSGVSSVQVPINASFYGKPINTNDEVSVYRNGGDTGDTYGAFNLIGIDLL